MLSVDSGGNYHGYIGDLARMAILGETDAELVDLLADIEGTQRAAGKYGTVSVSERVVPSVKDWDQFWSFIHRKKFYHLVERRAAVKACRELFEIKGVIPGVEPFIQRTLRLLSIGES